MKKGCVKDAELTSALGVRSVVVLQISQNIRCVLYAIASTWPQSELGEGSSAQNVLSVQERSSVMSMLPRWEHSIDFLTPVSPIEWRDEAVTATLTSAVAKHAATASTRIIT